jgi:hypothetical protein
MSDNGQVNPSLMTKEEPTNFVKHTIAAGQKPILRHII